LTNNKVCNEIEGITKEPFQEQVGLLDMGNEAATCAEMPIEYGYYTVDQGEDVGLIQKYLERPILISSGNLISAPGPIYNYAFDDTTAYRNLFGTANWDRMKGAMGVRGTLVFTLNVTASAFNQGILALAYQYGLSTPSSNQARHLYFPFVTNLPHVRINIASTTMVQLEVPFVSAREYIPIAVQNYTTVNGGIVSLTNLTGSRVAAGQDPARYTLYVSMKDVELIGAMPFDVTAITLQAGDATRHTSTRATQRTGFKVTGRSDVSTEGQHQGLLSAPLQAVSDASAALSHMPGLSKIGGMTNWFSAIAADTAEALGFSKPLDETLIQRMTRQSYALDGQVDVPTNAFALAPFQGNKVAVDPSVGLNDEDEMRFDHILTKYQYIFHGTLTTAAAPGDFIYGTPICPTAFWFRDNTLGASAPKSNKPLKTSNTATENAFLPSTLCYVADSFRWWRGGYKFRFSFAKTKLHGGRVQVTYIPTVQNQAINTPIPTTILAPTTTVDGPVATGYSYVFDLRDADEFEFEVPYVCLEPYTSTYGTIGDLTMSIVAPLKSNSAAAGTVDFMVEVCALPGFEFATVAPSIMAGVPSSGVTNITYQSGLSLAPISDDASQGVVGEKFTSVKQVIMQPDYFTLDVLNATIHQQHFDPWFKANAPALAGPMSTTAQALWFASRSSRFAHLFAFCRGGTMAIVQKEVGAQRVTASFSFKGNLGGAATSTFSSFYDKGNSLYSTVLVADSMESVRVKIPIYGNLARYPVVGSEANLGGDSLTPNTNTWNTRTFNVVPELRVRNNSLSSTRVVIGRAAADDAILSRFIGPPACIVFNSLATVSPVYGNTLVTSF